MPGMPPGEGAHTGWRGMDARQRRVLGSTLSANALVFFEQTAVILALPAIRREFGASAPELQWVVTAYLLALAVFMLVAGRVADHAGRRRTFLAGLVVFGVGSMLCAVAPGLPWLIAFRFVQGMGGAIVQPLALEVTTRSVREDQRGWAIGTLAAVSLARPTCEPAARDKKLTSTARGSRIWTCIELAMLTFTLLFASPFMTSERQFYLTVGT